MQENIEEAEIMQNDPDAELRDLAQSELIELKESLLEIEQELKKLLLPKDPDDSRNVFLEVRAGTGGDEAALFAGDLFRMYTRLSERNKWKLEVISVREGIMVAIKNWLQVRRTGCI